MYIRAAVVTVYNRYLSPMIKGMDHYKDELQGPDGRWVASECILFFNTQVIDTKELDAILLSNTTDREKHSLTTWTTKTFMAINNLLREGIDEDNEELIVHIDNIYSAISKCHIPDYMVVRRGVGVDYITRLLGDDSWLETPNSLCGKRLVDKGFMATTPFVNGGLKRQVMLYLALPKGTQAAYIESVATPRYKHQKELLIQSASTIIVKEAYTSGRGYVITADIE